MYARGHGVAQDEKEAFKWFEMAAAQGHQGAQHNVKTMMQDEKRAFRRYEKAAQQGDADAQYRLGMLYEYGQGVPKDRQKAAEWYQKAADQGHSEAQNGLSRVLTVREVFKRAIDENKKLFRSLKK